MLYLFLNLLKKKEVTSMFPNYNPFAYNYVNNVHKSGTIPFKVKEKELPKEDKTEVQDSSNSTRGIDLFGMNLQIDDLLIIAIICLMFLDLDKNYTMIIVLGLILLNINAGDLFNLF